MMRKGRPHKLEDAKRYVLYLDAPTVKTLRHAAQTRGYNISQLVRELVRELICEHEQESEDKTAA